MTKLETLLACLPQSPFKDQLTAEIQAIQADATHWKANHATEVARARILKERTDMPIERVKAYEQWGRDQAHILAMEARLMAIQAPGGELGDLLAELSARWLKEGHKPAAMDKAAAMLKKMHLDNLRLTEQLTIESKDGARYRAMRREALITRKRGKWRVTWHEPAACPTDSGISFRDNVDSAVDNLVLFHQRIDEKAA